MELVDRAHQQGGTVRNGNSSGSKGRQDFFIGY